MFVDVELAMQVKVMEEGPGGFWQMVNWLEPPPTLAASLAEKLLGQAPSAWLITRLKSTRHSTKGRSALMMDLSFSCVRFSFSLFCVSSNCA